MKRMEKQTKSLRRIIVLLLLILLGMPSFTANAAAIWNESNLHTGAVVNVGDFVVCTWEDMATELIYYDADNYYITSEYEDTGMSIDGYADPATGTTYSAYRVTNWKMNDYEMEVTLRGIRSVVSKSLSGIYVENPPYKTTYTEGESFNTSGMVVCAYYSDGLSAQINGYSVTPSGSMPAGTSSVTIRYSEGGITKTTTQAIAVHKRSTTTYTITAGAGPNGSITNAGAQTVNGGNNITYHFTPSFGYQVDYVVVDGANQGTIGSYTFYNVTASHSITVYFKKGVQTNYTVNVVGSFAAANGTGVYAPGAVVVLQAGTVPGYTFGGWVMSDGKIYPNAVTTLIMPGYNLVATANWLHNGTPVALSQVTTTNLKGTQLTSWNDIAAKLDTLQVKNLKGGSSCVLDVTVAGIGCYIDRSVISHLNTRSGVALHVSYGTDASFTFFSDVENAAYMGTELSYTAATQINNGVREKKIVFAQNGAIGTSICVNMNLPGAVPGQTAYVYLEDAKGTQTLYLPVAVDAAGNISVPVIAKVTLAVKY